MKTLLTRLQKRIRELKSRVARQSLSPERVRAAMVSYEQTGELPSDPMAAAYLRLLDSWRDATSAMSPVMDDPDAESRQQATEAAYSEALAHYTKLRRDHGIR